MLFAHERPMTLPGHAPWISHGKRGSAQDSFRGLLMWRRLYDATVRAAAHRHAQLWLAVLAFAESSFFPIPPDVMLAPMVLARPGQAWRCALIATAGSAAGGVFGYFIGVFFIEQIVPWLHELGYYQGYLTARSWFANYGFWAVLLAGFAPIPYKIFTIAAGAVGMLFVPFLVASIIGRGARFFLVAGLVRWGGPVFEQKMLKYIDWIGWAIVVVIIVVFVAYRWG